MVGALDVPAIETSVDVSPCVSTVEEEELLWEPSPPTRDIEEEPMDQELADLPPQALAVPEPKPDPSGYAPPSPAPTPSKDDR